jgi:hypothetical protein
MSKKLNLINLENAVGKNIETKTVHIDIFGEEFDVKVKQALTLRSVETMVEQITIYLQEFDGGEISPEMMFTMALLRSMTDIDFTGQTPEGDLVLLSYLVDTEKLTEIVNAIPMEVMKQLTGQIESAAKALIKEAEKNGQNQEAKE